MKKELKEAIRLGTDGHYMWQVLIVENSEEKIKQSKLSAKIHLTLENFINSIDEELCEETDFSTVPIRYIRISRGEHNSSIYNVYYEPEMINLVSSIRDIDYNQWTVNNRLSVKPEYYKHRRALVLKLNQQVKPVDHYQELSFDLAKQLLNTDLTVEEAYGRLQEIEKELDEAIASVSCPETKASIEKAKVFVAYSRRYVTHCPATKFKQIMIK